MLAWRLGNEKILRTFHGGGLVLSTGERDTVYWEGALLDEITFNYQTSISFAVNELAAVWKDQWLVFTRTEVFAGKWEMWDEITESVYDMSTQMMHLRINHGERFVTEKVKSNPLWQPKTIEFDKPQQMFRFFCDETTFGFRPPRFAHRGKPVAVCATPTLLFIMQSATCFVIINFRDCEKPSFRFYFQEIINRAPLVPLHVMHTSPITSIPNTIAVTFMQGEVRLAYLLKPDESFHHLETCLVRSRHLSLEKGWHLFALLDISEDWETQTVLVVHEDHMDELSVLYDDMDHHFRHFATQGQPILAYQSPDRQQVELFSDSHHIIISRKDTQTEIYNHINEDVPSASPSHFLHN